MKKLLAGVTLALAALASHAQPLSTPEEDEIQVFGHLVEPGEEFDGVKTLLLHLYMTRYMLSGRLDDAARICSAILKGSKMEVARKNALSCLAQLATTSGRFEEAESEVIAALEEAQNLSPGNERNVAASLKALAELYESRGFLQLAQGALTRAQTLLEAGPLKAVPSALKTAPLRTAGQSKDKAAFDEVIARLNAIQTEIQDLQAQPGSEESHLEALRRQEKQLLAEMTRLKALVDESIAVGFLYGLYRTILEERWFVLQALGKEGSAYEVATVLRDYVLAQEGDLPNPDVLLASSQYAKRQGHAAEAKDWLSAAVWQAKRNVGFPNNPPDPLPSTFNNPGAEALFGVPQRSASIARTISILGEVYLEQGNLVEARRFLTAALPGTEFARGKDSDEYARLLYYVSQVDLADGDTESGIDRLRSAMAALQEREEESAMLPGGRTVQLVRAQHLVCLGFISAVAKYKPGELSTSDEAAVFKAFHSLRRSATEGAVSGATLRSAEADIATQRAMDEYVRAGRRLMELRTSYAMAMQQSIPTSPLRSPSTGTKSEPSTKELADQIVRQKAAVARLKAAVPKAIATSLYEPTSAVRLTELQTALRLDETVIQFAFGSERTFALATSKESQALVTLSVGRDDIERLATAIKSGLKPSKSSANMPAFPLVEAHQLYESLLAPILARVPSLHRLIVVGDGPLDGLPLGALLTKPAQTGTSPSNYNTLHWLVADRLIMYVPSASTLVALRARGPSRADMDLLGVGGPPGSLSPTLRRGATVASLLPNATPAQSTGSVGADELKRIRAALPERTSLLFPLGTTRKTLKAMPLTRYRTIVFATHGYLANQMNELDEPSLLLVRDAEVPGSEYLRSTDVASLSLDANLVLLNACDTAGGDGLPGAEGLSGLASSFFFAGARTVVASLWPVEEKTASKVSETMMVLAATSRRLDSLTALQMATIRVLKEARGVRKHPSFWAPYILVGDGSVPPFGSMADSVGRH